VSGSAGPGAGARKQYHQGTHRIRSPEETWAAIAHLLPEAGITRVADVTALDRIGIPVYQAIRPASRNLSVSQGKGPTRMGARVSGAMEAMELWHAESLAHLPGVSLSLREMAFGNPIDHRAFKWRSDGVAPPSVPIQWLRAPSLVSDRVGWLPRDMMELDFTVSANVRPAPFHLTSNGLASGNCVEEALLHSLCELVERHALWLWQRGTTPAVPLHLESLAVPELVELIERIADASMKVAVYELTWCQGLPTILVDMVGPDLPHVWRGAGCHTSPIVAVSRALTEAAQSRLTYISGARDDLTQFADLGGSAAGPYVAFEPPTGERSLEELESLASEDVTTDLGRVLDTLLSHGLEPFWIDLTRPELGVPVVRCFVPTLGEARYH
jgi:ribosomal protein S12 methylthiotransferase accessory factor